jgi:hypothetical protein
MGTIAQSITSFKIFEFDKSTSSWCITKSNDNGFIIGGSYFIDQYNSDVFLMKVDSNGDSLWTIRSNGEYHNSIRDIIALNDTTYIGIGIANSQLSEQGFLYGDVLLLSFNTNGNLLWEKKYSTTRNDEGYKIIKSKFNGMIACGMCDNSAPNSLGSYWILRLNDVGDTLWARSLYMGPSSYAMGLFEDESENIYAIGSGAYIIKLDKNGTVLKTTKIEKEFTPRNFLELENSFFITGKDATGFFVGKFDLTGKHLWSKYFGGNFLDLLISIDSALLLISKKEPLSLYASKFNLDGTTVWSKKIEMDEDFTGILGANYNDNTFFLTGHITGVFNSKFATMILEENPNEVTLLGESSFITISKCGYRSISIKSDVKGIIIFYDQKGRKIIEKKIDKPSTTISNLSTGFFIYRFISSKNEIQTGKIIIK